MRLLSRSATATADCRGPCLRRQRHDRVSARCAANQAGALAGHGRRRRRLRGRGADVHLRCAARTGEPNSRCYRICVVREDAHVLYGFGTDDERQLFRSLIRISGVGARLALAILSGISVDGFVTLRGGRGRGRLTRLPGIGKKTAQRLIVEMRDRLPSLGTGRRQKACRQSAPRRRRARGARCAARARLQGPGGLDAC